MVLSPTRLFFYALAFRFAAGRGRCFSPGLKALIIWHVTRFNNRLLNKATAKWLRAHCETFWGR